MIDYSVKLPSEQKYDRINNLGKIPLRKILKKFNIEQFISSEKHGFSVNTLNLWKSFAKDTCKNYLLDSRAVKAGLLDEKWIKKYLVQNDLNVSHVNKFLRSEEHTSEL